MMNPVRKTLDYNRRLSSLKDEVAKRGLDAFLVTNDINVSYLTGFLGHDSILLITSKKKFFITDSRYIEEARERTKGFGIELVRCSTYDTLKEIVSKNHLRRVGFESMNLPYGAAARLKRMLAPARLVPVSDLIENIRAVKDEAEMRLIRDSTRLAKKVFHRITNFIKAGASEEFLSNLIEIEFLRRKAKAAFVPIVACGKNSSRPHAHPTASRIAKDSFVMIDLGSRLNGYCSDLTRMVLVGKAGDRFREIYNIVRSAQKTAIDVIKPGARASSVDWAARNYIIKKGFGRYFGHSVGHGVGMAVHELPAIAKSNEYPLKTGMVFTVEPAIYIPGFGGIRIEDVVVVTDSGCEVLIGEAGYVY